MNRRRFLIRSGQALTGACFLAAGWPGIAAGQRPAVGGTGAPPDVENWLAAAVERLEKSHPYAYGLYTLDDGITIAAKKTGLTVTREGPREGVVLGVWTGLGFREQATAFVDQAGIVKATDRLAEASGGMRASDGPDPGPALRKTWIESGDVAPESVPLSDRVERVRSAEARLRAREAKLLAVTFDMLNRTTTRIFVNRTRRLTQVLSRCGYQAWALFPDAKGGSPGSYWLTRRGVGGLERSEMPDADLDLLIERASRLAGTASPDPGEKIVITEPEITGVLAHESFGHGVEVDMFVKGRARAADYLGRRVGSDRVQILDDPTTPGGYGTYHFDDEGYSAAPTRIVENGIFKAGLTDMLSASEMKLPRTANGRREAYDHKQYSRMSNTFFAPGTETLDELLNGVRDGILVGRLNAGMEDPKGWGIQIVAQYGEEIRNGRLTGKAYSPVTISGFVPDVLASVDGSSRVFELSSGSCGKGNKEVVPVGMGGPHLRFRARIS